MCGRYTYYSSSDILKELDLLSSESPQVKLALNTPDNYNVSPGNEMPVIVRGVQEHTIEFMTWGLIPSWSKTSKTTLKLINARKEGILEKPMWRRLVKSKRCIVPARGFYEWKKIGSDKIPYYITSKTGSVLSFAGLWDEWKDEEGKLILTYTIVTTTPNKEMSVIHDRMPVILNKQQMDEWLQPTDITQSQLDDLLTQSQDNTLNINHVSADVNNSRNNSKELIYSLK